MLWIWQLHARGVSGSHGYKQTRQSSCWPWQGPSGELAGCPQRPKHTNSLVSPGLGKHQGQRGRPGCWLTCRTAAMAT